MKEEIRQKALALGFDACRFCVADPPDHAREFSSWVADKQFGEMSWIERNAHKRVDPQKVLPGARSIISLAASYHEPENNSSRGGLVARYARGRDYHDVLAGPLKELAGFVDQCGPVGTRSLWYVDTGPILERDMAQRAGLGFVGKHTGLISRQFGNWIILAEILTTLELEPDAAERNRCGSCTKCIAACPTNAIRAPFELDARRCISYLTIELKGSIPVEFRASIGDRLFGCDDCLAACPWNRFAQEARLLRQEASHRWTRLDLHRLVALDDAAFKQEFAGTPMLRTKRRGMVRNACVVLGNTGESRDLPVLERLRNGGDDLIAEHAAWAIEQVTTRERSRAGKA